MMKNKKGRREEKKKGRGGLIFGFIPFASSARRRNSFQVSLSPKMYVSGSHLGRSRLAATNRATSRVWVKTAGVSPEPGMAAASLAMSIQNVRADRAM
jgi:hypothetical protein